MNGRLRGMSSTALTAVRARCAHIMQRTMDPVAYERALGAAVLGSVVAVDFLRGEQMLVHAFHGLARGEGMGVTTLGLTWSALGDAFGRTLGAASE